LHALGIAKVTQFKAGSHVLDVGCGGGFPGLPLAILMPDVQFTLVDSIGKKIKVVDALVDSLKLNNVKTQVIRAEQIKEKFDFVVSRAVAPMDKIYRWTQSYIMPEGINSKFNGYLLLKGGDLKEEKQNIKGINRKLRIEELKLSNYFEEEFFETKKLIHIY
jgi:16S rRNA (guanine527-N7)-methyltransferase